MSKSVFNVGTMIFNGESVIVETKIGPTFTVKSHPAFRQGGDKTLTLTEIRADGEDDDSLKLSLRVNGETFPLTLISMAEPNRKRRPTSAPQRPVVIVENPDMISAGPDW